LLLARNHSFDRLDDSATVDESSEIQGNSGFINAFNLLAHQVIVFQIVEFFEEVLLVRFPLKELVHFSVARERLSDLFEFRVIVGDPGVDVNCARHVEFDTEHDALLVDNPETHDANVRSLLNLDDVPVRVEYGVVHITHKIRKSFTLDTTAKATKFALHLLRSRNEALLALDGFPDTSPVALLVLEPPVKVSVRCGAVGHL